VQVGNWFPLPPVHAPTFPLLVVGQPPLAPQEEVLAVVQEVQRGRHGPVPPTLTSIFAGDRFPSFFAELDPYQAERTEPVWDPPELLTPLPPARSEQSFFAYLTANWASAEAWLTKMALTGSRGTAYLRSAPPDLKERLRLQGLKILDEPPAIADMMAEAAVMVHHGGAGLANSALTGGRPQLLFPQHLEQVATAHLLAKLGVAIFLLNSAGPESAGRALRKILGNRRHADNAVSWARRLQERPRRPLLPAVVACCRQRLQERTP
jgi:hypothetical protein